MSASNSRFEDQSGPSSPGHPNSAPGDNASGHFSPARASKEDIAESKEEYTDYVSGFRLATLLAGVTVVVFLILLDQTIVSTATPVITSDLNALSDVGWYAGAYQLAR